MFHYYPCTYVYDTHRVLIFCRVQHACFEGLHVSLRVVLVYDKDRVLVFFVGYHHDSFIFLNVYMSVRFTNRVIHACFSFTSTSISVPVYDKT